VCITVVLNIVFCSIRVKLFHSVKVVNSVYVLPLLQLLLLPKLAVIASAKDVMFVTWLVSLLAGLCNNYR